MECPTPHSSTEKTLPHNRNKPMKNFQDFVFKLAQARPNAPLSPSAQILLRDRLESFASQYRTPDHPPYSAMIQNALEELNEKGGSKEKSISQYLEKKYDNLPWAHSALLKHHLGKTLASGDIVVNHAKKYRLAESRDLSTELDSKPLQKRKLRERKRWKHNPGTSRPRKKRKRPRGKNVRGITKHQECEEKEQRSTQIEVKGMYKKDQTKSLLSFVDGENSFPTDSVLLLTQPPSIVAAANENKSREEVRSELETGPSAVAELDICATHTQESQESEKSEHNQLESATPERPPGFESVRVENLPQLGSSSTEPKPASSEEDPTLRQLKSRTLKIVFRCKKPPEQPLKDASMDGLKDPQKKRVLLKQKPNVEALEVVDDCKEQDFEQSRKDGECSSMKLPKKQRLGRPPRRRSARLLEAKIKTSDA